MQARALQTGPHPGRAVRSFLLFQEEGVISSWTFSCWVGGDNWSWHHQPSSSSWSGVCVLVGSLWAPGGGFSTCTTAQRTWLRILPIVLEEELKILDFNGWTIMIWSCLTVFPFFLHFLPLWLGLWIGVCSGKATRGQPDYKYWASEASRRVPGSLGFISFRVNPLLYQISLFFLTEICFSCGIVLVWGVRFPPFFLPLCSSVLYLEYFTWNTLTLNLHLDISLTFTFQLKCHLLKDASPEHII